MTNPIKESELEERIISLLQEQGYFYSVGSEIKRDGLREVFILEDLGNYLKKKHPNLISHDIRVIADEIQLENKSLYEFNREFIQETLINGKSYIRDSDDESFLLKLIDFEAPSNNIFRVVNQLVVQEYETQRVDLAIYINGIPFVIWELKSPSNQSVGLEQAHTQIRTYVNEISCLFKYNAFVVLCDEINCKLGSAWGDYEHFYEWKKIDDSIPPEDNLVNTTIKGLFNKERLVKIIEDFICFSDEEAKQKIICRYPQFFGATKLLRNIEKNLRPKGKGKGGVYHGATGCGKSYIMLFLSRLLMRSKTFKRPLILLITDRSELNDQLTQLFEKHSNYLQVASKTNIKKVGSRTELKDLFKRFTSGTIFLTNIQKFAEDNELLSDKSNIICISDEAHRSQHNLGAESREEESERIVFSVPFAKRVRDSLPNATYVGFTATPKDETMDVFGDVVDQYSMDDSKNDNFTVELITEERRLPIEMNDTIAELMDSKYSQLKQQGSPDRQIAKHQAEFLQMKKLIEHPERVSKVAEDILKHYDLRVQEGATVKEKAMIVVNSRDVGWEMYKKIKDEKPEWFVKPEDYDSDRKFLPKVNMVMTRHGKEGSEYYELLGDEKYQKMLAQEFKDKDSNFKIAILKDKWLTGFDVPFLDTMYLDRMLHDANLIQTISRVNRKFLKKNYGLIVHYLPINKELAEARRKYGGEQSLNRTKEEVHEIVHSAQDQLELLNELFYGFDKSPFFGENEQERFKCIWEAVNWIESKAGLEKKFIDRFTAFRKEYVKCASSDLLPESVREQSNFYCTLWAVYMKHHRKIVEDKEILLGEKIKELFEQVFLCADPKILFLGAIRVSLLTEADLDKIVKSGNVHQANKRLILTLEEANKEFTKINSKKGLEFSEKLRKLKDKYNSLESVTERIGGQHLTKEEIIERNKEVDREAEEIQDELVELGREYIKANETYKNLGLNRLETVFFEILLETRDQFELEYPEEKLIELSKEIKKLVIEQSRQIDWWKKGSIKAQIGMNITLLLAKYGYTKKKGKIVSGLSEEVIRRSVEFKKHYESEWN